MLPKFLKRLFTKRKIALLLVFCFLFSVISSKSLLAFSTQTGRGGYLWSFETAVFQNPEMNLQSFVNETFKATIASVWTSIVGCISCTKEERHQYPGLLLSMTGLTASIYANPPASGVQYLAYLGNKLNLTQPVYAQDAGTGFNTMRSILPLWEAFRNLSYSFFVIIFVIIGFAIMFRIKISPQAVVTIESALPKLIIALLLITFSYAIIGFLIDIMLVLSVLIASVFKPLLEEAGGTLLLNLFHKLFGLTGPSATITLAIIPDFVEGAILLTAIGVVIVSLLGAGIGAAGGAIASFWTGPGVAPGAVIGAAVGGILFALIFILLLIIILIRCLWTLLKALINIILATIFAPFIILVGALPGSNAISGWFRNILANIAVLPAMLTMFLLASFFGLVGIAQLTERMADVAGIGVVLTALGLLDFSQFFNLLFSQPAQDLTSSIFPFIGLGILFLAPKTADIIQSFISGQPFAYGTAIGQAFAPLAYPAGLARTGIEKKFADDIGEAVGPIPGGLLGKVRTSLRTRGVREPHRDYGRGAADMGRTPRSSQGPGF